MHLSELPMRNQNYNKISPQDLGNLQFLKDYRLKYAYIAGAMYKGIASEALVVAMARAGMLGYFGTGGLTLEKVSEAIDRIKNNLTSDQPFGMNLLFKLDQPEQEMKMVDLYLSKGVSFVEVAAYMQVTPALIRYRLKGARRAQDGSIYVPNRLLAKVSRPEVAAVFMSPPASEIVNKLLIQALISEDEAELANQIPVAQEICVESDSGGHTDQGCALALLPCIKKIQERLQKQFNFTDGLRIGAAGGIGTPESALAAFSLGADFIMTGSVNQCTVEAGTSAAVKDILQSIGVQDTTYAPAGDMFEIGAKVQVVKKGTLFPMRANKLYDLYLRHDAMEDIEADIIEQIQNKIFKRDINQVWQETRSYYQSKHPHILAKIEKNPKRLMAAIFRWYFIHSTRIAMNGDPAEKSDYQIHCGPALGAFNEWVRGTELENWRNRHVDHIGIKIMEGAAELMTRQLHRYMSSYSRTVDTP